MELACALGLGALLMLPAALGSDGSAGATSGSVTIVLLVVLLLVLVAGLALAWRRLSRDSNGYYHPARLGAALWGRTRRLFWASPPGLWLQARVGPGPPGRDPESQDDPDAEEAFNLDGGHEEAEDREEEEPACGNGLRPGSEASGAEDTHEGAAESLGLGAQGPAGAGGSSEALLSDLHAFAGSAAWDDSAGPAGGQGLHVTAL